MNPDQRRNVFISLAAQHDNLGDMVIRREMVRWVADAGVRVHALVADAPDDFVDAVGLPVDAVRHRSLGRWQAAFLASAARGRGGLVFSPGPQRIGPGVRPLLHETANLANLVVLRIRRQPAAKLGRSLVGSSNVGRAIEQMSFRLCGEYWLRDEPSAAVLQRDAMVLPDISLATGGLSTGSPTSERSLVAVSPRHDSGWTLDDVRVLAQQAAAVEHELVVVTQVRRDEPVHQALSSAVGARHIDWSRRSTSEQLQRVIDVYRQSSLVVSDRLHALLFGLTQGATPVLRRPDEPKTSSALAVLDVGEAIPHAQLGIAASLEWRRRFHPLVERSRVGAAQRLDDARARLSRLLSSGRD